MILPKLNPAVQRKASVIPTGFTGGIEPQRLYCSTGPCVKGQQLHMCVKEVYKCIPGTPGSPDLGIPGTPPYCYRDYETTHLHYHPCVKVLPNISTFPVLSQ